jgi:serine/threonine protein kinase
LTSDTDVNSDVIHGDIKPQNILIYDARSNHYCEPRLIDFGYSSIIDPESESFIRLPMSVPWCAPERTAYDRFTPDQALRMDVFSFGMVCFWIMYEKHISRIDPLPLASGWADTYFEPETRFEHAMCRLKDDDKLVLLATQLVDADEHLEFEQRQKLTDFFNHSLPKDPKSRAWNLGELDRCFEKYT